MDKFSRQKISKGIVELNNTIDELDTMGIYRKIHPTIAECILMSIPHKPFSKTDHSLCHKT
jgi:hypothetical protein